MNKGYERIFDSYTTSNPSFQYVRKSSTSLSWYNDLNQDEFGSQWKSSLSCCGQDDTGSSSCNLDQYDDDTCYTFDEVCGYLDNSTDVFHEWESRGCEKVEFKPNGTGFYLCMQKADIPDWADPKNWGVFNCLFDCGSDWKSPKNWGIFNCLFDCSSDCFLETCRGDCFWDCWFDCSSDCAVDCPFDCHSDCLVDCPFDCHSDCLVDCPFDCHSDCFFDCWFD